MLSAISVLDSLIRAGMRHIVLSPGSRSAPLAYAVAAAETAGAIVAHVRVDERTAGFTALGIAKASGRPVGLVCTSGTALGEYVPAVMEAYHTGVPLAIISADRPEKLRGTGANQTTFQHNLYGRFVRASADLTRYPEQSEGEQTQAFKRCLAALTGRDAHNWSRASDEPLGPAHINLCLDSPLVPDEQTARILPQWAASLTEHTDYAAEARQLAEHLGTAPHEGPGTLTALSPIEAGWLVQHKTAQAEAACGTPLPDTPQTPKTVVVAGDGAGPFAAEFASALNLPLFAEPSSGARGGRTSIPHYVELLGTDARSELGAQIERMVLFGHPTLSRPISALLGRESIPQAYYAPRKASWYEPGARAAQEIDFPADAAIFALKGAAAGSTEWLEQWTDAGTAQYAENQRRIAQYRSQSTPHQAEHTDPVDRTAGQALAHRLWVQCAADHHALVVGSSNLVRDLDRAAPALGEAGPARVYANRGLAGIDGTVATAIGISLAGYYPTGTGTVGGAALPVRLLCGDLTFQHDVAALNLPVTELLPNLEVHVFDDSGGSIFSTLEHGELARQEQFSHTVDRFFTVRAAENTDLEAMAAGFGTASGVRVSIHRP
jgi:2-succinyl-5-enolpyruvyl-6-hydroxy-3-cyclohexene-1-carboxylic-acid synthase